MYDLNGIWKPKENIEAIIIAIHGYIMIVQPFDIPATNLKVSDSNLPMI